MTLNICKSDGNATQKSASNDRMSNTAVINGKIVFVGMSGIGKTSIINCQNKSKEEIIPTCGAVSISTNVFIKDKKYILNVWDTSGEKEFECLIPMYVRLSEIGVIIVSSSNQNSIESLPDSDKFLSETMHIMKVIIVNNIKKDQENAVDPSIVKKEAERLNRPYFVVSTTDGEGIQDLFEYLVKETSQRTTDDVVIPEEEKIISTEQPTQIEDPEPYCNCGR